MSTNNVRVYDARGRYVRVIGRRGQGPGEFRQVMGLTRRPGDTLAAPNLPAYAQLVDNDRNLWVSDASLDWYLAQGFSRVPAGPVAWRVFDRDGRWLGSVTMPPRFRPMDIGSDYVLGLWRDADDVEHVRLYQLTRPRS
jgi:hypothetical protein